MHTQVEVMAFKKVLSKELDLFKLLSKSPPLTIEGLFTKVRNYTMLEEGLKSEQSRKPPLTMAHQQPTTKQKII